MKEWMEDNNNILEQYHEIQASLQLESTWISFSFGSTWALPRRSPSKHQPIKKLHTLVLQM